jgi:glycosyltransferase involved in cell wall biosynthesis
MEEKSQGHLKLERVNRRLTTALEQSEIVNERSLLLLASIKNFHTLSDSLQQAVLDALSENPSEGSSDDLAKETENLENRIKMLEEYLSQRKSEVEILKGDRRDLGRINSSAKTAILDAIRQMWGGYAERGQQKLVEFAYAGHLSSSLRALACYELARFYADTGKPYGAMRVLTMARALSRTYMRGTRQRVLESELLMEIGDVDSAREKLLEYQKYRPEDPNYRIGLANTLFRRNDLAGQLNVLNDLFMDSNMSTITCTDPQAPFLSLQALSKPDPVKIGPKVSILMSTYNAAEFLRLAIGSMLAQTYENIEILVTDDCSTDGSRGILKEMAREDPRLIVIENTTNLGTYGNRNQMLKRVTGEFVTVHDADDWSHPQMIEHQVSHLMDNPDIRLNTTLMCRVSLDLKFNLRPSRASLEYCHMNYPGFLMRTQSVKRLGGWDPIMANADAEFERRVKHIYGRDSFAIINPETIYSFFLVHDNSLTQQKKMNLRSLTFGSRNEYHRQSEHWMEARKAEAIETGEVLTPFVLHGRSSAIEPFPSPNSLMIPRLKHQVLDYDVLIMSDLFLLGGTRGCNINYIRTLHAKGKRVAIFNWPRADLRFSADISGAYRDLKQEGLVDIVTWEDSIRAKRVIIHHPPIVSNELDSYPDVETEKVVVLVNQLPFQTTEREREFYDPVKVTERLTRIFRTDNIEWITISPLAMDYLSEYSGVINLSDQIWYPPNFTQPDLMAHSVGERFERMQKNGPSFVRHSRDHWTKWPSSDERNKKMYMSNKSHNFKILGGGKEIRKSLGGLPDAWTVLEYDEISVSKLLNDGDVYLNFNNEVYIEEFGRNVMEALFYGLPVITEKSFERTFGDAVLIADDNEGSAAITDRLISDKTFFEEQVARGQAFVQVNCSTEAVVARMEAFLD